MILIISPKHYFFQLLFLPLPYLDSYSIQFKFSLTFRSILEMNIDDSSPSSQYGTLSPDIHQFIANNAEIWLFGYGSLCWRPGFNYSERRLGILPNYARRFYQYSTDHRGTDDYPGLVATLLPTSHQDYHPQQYQQQLENEDQHGKFQQLYNHQIDSCVGVCFLLNRHEVKTILSYLDHREKNGYTAVITDIHTLQQTNTVLNESSNSNLNQHKEFKLDSSEPGKIVTVKAISWFATDENEFYSRHLDDKIIAERINKAVGPSGPNIDYLSNLHQFMTDTNCEDIHLNTIMSHIRELNKENTSL